MPAEMMLTSGECRTTSHNSRPPIYLSIKSHRYHAECYRFVLCMALPRYEQSSSCDGYTGVGSIVPLRSHRGKLKVDVALEYF